MRDVQVTRSTTELSRPGQMTLPYQIQHDKYCSDKSRKFIVARPRFLVMPRVSFGGGPCAVYSRVYKPRASGLPISLPLWPFGLDQV
jgi:hypothetical protein